MREGKCEKEKYKREGTKKYKKREKSDELSEWKGRNKKKRWRKY